MLRVIKIIVCILLYHFSWSQKIGDDFKKVNAFYSNNTNLSMSIMYNLYHDYYTAEVYDSYKGQYKKKGDKLYSDLLGIETISNNKYAVTINKNDKMIVVADPINLSSLPTPVNADSLVKICSSITFSESDEDKIYKMNFDKSPYFEYKMVEIFINKKNFYLDKLVLYFRDAIKFNYDDIKDKKDTPRVEIIYSNVNNSSITDDSFFSEKKYIMASNGKYSSVGKFSDYKIVNHKLKDK